MAGVDQGLASILLVAPWPLPLPPNAFAGPGAGNACNDMKAHMEHFQGLDPEMLTTRPGRRRRIVRKTLVTP